MNLSVPVLVWSSVEEHTIYHVRPLFHPAPLVSNARLERALAKLASSIRRELHALGDQAKQDDLAAWAFDPPLVDKRFSFELPFKRRTVRGNFLVVLLPDQTPRVAFCPELPDLWFEVSRGSDLRECARAALEQYFSRGPGAEMPAEHEIRAWVTQLEVDFAVPSTPSRLDHDPTRLILGGRPAESGWRALERVGRCLDDDYPHDLFPCLGRDFEAEQVHKSLENRARDGLVVVGARKVGKTSLLHEQVRRSRESGLHSSRRFWLLSPQRLISGMSFVGQWESRVLAILNYAEEKNLVLVFDDLLGLLSAGVTRDSNLSVADVLKPYLQNRRVRVLAEATSEAWSILRERDRGLADLFTPVHLHPTGDAQTFTIALEQVRAAERTHHCRFHLEALTNSIELQRRYVRDAVFPGKVANFLRRLATRHPREEVGKEQVTQYFHATSGLDLRLLKKATPWSREQVITELRDHLIGQPDAVEAAADALMACKAGLNDPDRPLASYLFVGPTGVGKTECAKALARVLFSDITRLLRFDMNEYGAPGSAARLVGTFHDPDGLLTSSVRRQPFCVLLLDEIEKAHPEVFQLLLQLLSDGRLTDARGRTVDFTQTLVVLTSNLGAQEAGRTIGLTSKVAQEGLSYRRAVEDFFSPEFFNRLDRIVVFSRLERAEVAELAQRLLKKFLRREGLVRRQCHLQISRAAMEKVVDLGFHPKLGARALKRSIEAAIASPLAKKLSTLDGGSPTVITLTAEPELTVNVRELRAAAPNPPLASPTRELLRRVDSYLESKEASLEIPETTVVDGELTAQQLRYYAFKDRIRRARGLAARLSHQLSQTRPSQPRRGEVEHSLLMTGDWSQVLQKPSLSDALRAVAQTRTERGDERSRQLRLCELIAELAPLGWSGEEEQAVLEIPLETGNREWGEKLHGLYRELFLNGDFQVKSWLEPTSARLEISGPDASRLVEAEAGFHLFATPQRLQLLEVLGGDSVVRAYSPTFGTLDLRSGWMSPGLPTARELELLLLTGIAPLGESL